MALQTADFGTCWSRRSSWPDTLRPPPREGRHQEFYLGIKEQGARGKAALERSADLAIGGAMDSLATTSLTDVSRSTAAIRSPSCSGTRCRRATGRTAFREKDLGIWRATSWREYGERARAVGMGLVKLGLKRRDVVSIMSETVPEWLYADMGTLGAGGVSNGIYPTDSAKQVDYILNDSRSALSVVENEEQLDKVIEVRERCPGGRQGLRLRHGGPRRFQRSDGHGRSRS